MSHQAPRALWPKVRRIAAKALPYWRSLALASFLIFLGVVASLLLPMGMKFLLDKALSGSDTGLLNQLAGALLAIFLVRSLLGFCGQFLLRVTGEKIVAGLRQEVYEHLHRLDLAYHGKQRLGDLTSRLTNDTASIRSLATDALVSAVLQVFQLIGSITLMALLNWRLMMLVIVFAPLATLVSRSFAPSLERISRKVQDRLAHSAAVAQEVLAAMPLVQAFGRSSYETRRFRVTLDQVVDSGRDSARVGALFSSIMNLLFAVSSVAIFWFGGREVLAGRLTAGDLVAFMFYSQVVSEGFGALAQHLAALSSAVGASERVFEILDTAPRVVEDPAARRVTGLRGRIELDRVGFSYEPDRPLLEDLSFTVEPGQTLALVGPSGAGKSTILQLLLRLYDPTAGRILLDGHDLRKISLESLREQIAIVSQEVYIFGTSVRDNIRYGRIEATDAEVEAAAKAADAHEFIAKLPSGYDTMIGERGIGLSGGQRQRLSIARALLKNARILILDEATSSVDPSAEAAIYQAIDRLCADRTTIRVTHRLASLRAGDRVLAIDEGKIVESGTQKELLGRNGLFRRLSHGRTIHDAAAIPSVA